MYSKATYITPYKVKIARALGMCAKNLKSNIVYAILANAKIKPVDHDKYGTPLYSYNDLDALVKSYRTINDAYNKWKEDMIKQDIEGELKKMKRVPGYSVHRYDKDNTAEIERRKEMEKASDELLRQQEVYFDDPEDDRLYESMFGKKVYFTESQIQYIKEHLLKENESKISKKVTKDGNNINIEYEFGKNGLGITNELELIGNEIADLSKDYNLYLSDPFFDTLDDVYSFKVVGSKREKKLNEGSWGYEVDQRDDYLDETHDIGEPVIKILLDKFRDLPNFAKDRSEADLYARKYILVGLTLAMLKVKAFFESWLYSADDSKRNDDKYKINRELFELVDESFKDLVSDRDNKQGWYKQSAFKKYKKVVRRMYDEFKQLRDYYNMDLNQAYRTRGTKGLIHEASNYVDPRKVLLVSKYLDDNFVRASIPTVGADGYPSTMKIVGMKGTDGQVMRNMSSKDLFYLLQDKFKGIYGDKNKRDSFLKQVMTDWYNKKISREGMLSKNTY